jgi:phosphoglycolate phosphatase
MKNYELVIFDLDGTILDTTEGIIASITYTINLFKLPQLSSEKLLSFIGPPIQDSFSKYYELSNEDIQKLTDTFRDNYSEYNLLLAKPYNGIYDVWHYLTRNNIKSAIATYKREDYALRLLQHFHFDSYTNVIFGGDYENILKKREIIARCIDKSNINDKKKIVIIGDTNYDAIAAESLNIDFIAVTYGFGFKKKEDLLGTKFITVVTTPLEIIKYINED